MVVLELIHDGGFGVLGAYTLILHVDLVDTALIDQPIVLVVTDLALFASLKLLPGLFFNHRCVCIQVLPLQSDLLQLLGKTSFLFSLLLLLVLDLAVHLEKALLACCLRFSC